MNTESIQLLSASQRHQLLAAVYRELFLSCPARPGEERTSEGVAMIEKNLDTMVAIVRRSTAERLEPYLAQVLDGACSKCKHQEASGFCAQRAAGPCSLYRFTAPIVRAMQRALAEMGDAEYLANRP